MQFIVLCISLPLLRLVEALLVYHPWVFIYVGSLFLCNSSTLSSSLYPPSTWYIPYFIIPLLSWACVLPFAYPIILLMLSFNNYSMWLDGSVVISTPIYPLDLFIVVFGTVHLHIFRSSCSILLSFSLDNCPLISIIFARRSSHIIYLSRHHFASPYGSRGQGTKLKLLCSSFAGKLPALKT